jgi:hypothetical protein
MLEALDLRQAKAQHVLHHVHGERIEISRFKRKQASFMITLED